MSFVALAEVFRWQSVGFLRGRSRQPRLGAMASLTHSDGKSRMEFLSLVIISTVLHLKFPEAFTG